MNPKEFVEQYCIKSLACMFSGGQDSLVSTHYIMSELEGKDIDKHVVHVDTGAMLPIVAPYVEDVCHQFGWKRTILYGHFFEKAEKYGMPTMFRRWCCWECKIKPTIPFMKTLQPQRAEVLGLRKDESLRRQKLKNQVIYKKIAPTWAYAPILFWTEKQVIQYIKEHDLPVPPHYRLGLRETCQCGAFSSKKQMMTLKGQFPQLFEKFIEIEKRFKSGGAAFYFQDKPVYAKDLAKQKTMREFSQNKKNDTP